MIRKWIYKLRYFLILLSALLGLLGVGGAFGLEPYELEFNLPGTGYYSYYGNYPYTYSITSNLDFNTDGNKYFLYTYDGGSYDGTRSRLVFWNDGKLATYIGFRGSSRFVYGQGYYKKACLTNTIDLTGACYNSSNYTYDVSELFNTYQSFNRIFLRLESHSNNLLCFISDSDDISICIRQALTYGRNDWNTIEASNILSVNGGVIPSDFAIESYEFEDSPLVGGGGGGDFPDIIGSGSTVLTNSAVALGLSYRYGYGVEDCYGGYPLNDIFTADLDPSNFTGYLYGSGASIYDIFNAYSGSYFTDINTFYNSFYSRYSIGNISSFWYYPKGLYSISQRAGLLGSIYNLYPVNMSNLVEYCDLKLKSDLDALYTGDNYIGIEGYYSLIGEVYDKRRYYDTDLLSGSDSTGSMSIDEFFSSVSNRLVGGLQDVADNRVGVIPSYILMVMMALILFRLISH